MRVLVTSTPGLGHIHPMVPVVLALRDAGHDVRWATGRDACPAVERCGINAVPAGLPLAARAHAARGLQPELASLRPRQRRPVSFRALFGTLTAGPMAADLRRVVTDWPPDLIVHEPCELVAGPLARGLGVPHVVVGFGGLVPNAILEAVVDDLRAQLVRAGLDHDAAPGLYDDLYLHPLPGRPWAPTPPTTVRPCRPGGFDGASADPAPAWVSALGRGRPCVYVTFGTEFGPVAPIGPVLEALGQRDVDAVLTLGRDLDPGVVCANAPGNVRVERYVPQRFLLERVSLLVSHVGSGAMLGAISAGLPHLGLPMGADQFDNADLVTSAGLGLCLDPEDVAPASISDAIDRLLDEPGFGRAAKAMAAELSAMPAPADHLAEIEALASKA